MQQRQGESTDMTMARVLERLGQDMEYRKDFQKISVWVLSGVIAAFLAIGAQTLFLMGQTSAMSHTLEEHSARIVALRSDQEVRNARIESSMRDIQTDVKELLQRTATHGGSGK